MRIIAVTAIVFLFQALSTKAQDDGSSYASGDSGGDSGAGSYDQGAVGSDAGASQDYSDSTESYDQSAGYASEDTGSDQPPASDSDASAGNSTAADAVEKSVPAYPPLGEKSALVDQWTPQGILNAIGDNGEGALGDRWNLQKALKGSVDEKNASMTGVMKLVAESRGKMMGFAKNQQNISTLLYADASAGGIVASVRDIRNEVPATQKLLSKTMQDQLKSLEKDAVAMKNAVQVAESEYRQRIQAMADTISSMIAQQDALFARLAAKTARAMAQTSQSLQNKALGDVSAVNNNITATKKQGDIVASNANTGVRTASVALGDVTDSLGEIDGQYQDAMKETVGVVDGSIRTQSDKSQSAFDKAVDSGSSSAQADAMKAGIQVSQQLDKLDRNATNAVGKLIDNTTKVAGSLAKAVDKTVASTEKALNQATSTLTKNLDSIDSQSQIVTSDQMKILQDAQGLIQKEQATSSATGTGISTDFAKLIALLSSQLGGLTGQAKTISQDVVGGTSEEAIRLSRALSYLMNQASAGSNGIGANARTQLAQEQKSQSELIAQRQAQIGGASDSLNSELSDASRQALRGAGAMSERITGMSATYEGSIAALVASLNAGAGSSKQGVSEISGSLSNKASDAFAGIIEALKGVNNNGADQQEDFLKTILGPARDGSAKQMDQVQVLIAALSEQLNKQNGGQTGLVKLLRSLQAGSGKKIANASKLLESLRALTNQQGSSVGAAGEKALAEARARMVASLMDELNGAKNQSAEGLSKINQFVGMLVGGKVSDTNSQVGNTIALAGANLDASSQNFVKVEREQIKSLAGLSSAAASLLGESANAGLEQKTQTEASLANARKNIVAKFKEMAANTTDTELGKVMQDLARQGNETSIVNFLLGDVQTAMKRIDADAVMARDATDKKRAELEAYIAESQAKLEQAQADIVAQLDATISGVQKALDERIRLIQTSQGEMTFSLNDIKAKVVDAQNTLAKNLQIYQDKLDGIIKEIRSYMNLAADADELAIRRDIANQLGKVNATEVAIASANAAVAKGIADRSKSNDKTGGAAFDIVDGVINGAVETEASVSDAHLGHTEQLLAVAADVDARATELDGSIKTASEIMENGIAGASSTADRAITSGEAGQAKNVGQLNDRATDVASQSRKNFVSHLERMGNIDDDTLRVSKQLQTLIGNADGTITDVSESAMSHLELSVKTMAKLNQAEVRKVASVSDVMQAFSAVVVGFLNETGSTMETVMNELNSVDSASKAKLKQIDTRSKDEMNWVDSGLNSTVDSFKESIAQEQAMQAGLKQKLLEDESFFKASEASKISEPGDIQDQVTLLKQKVNKHQSDQLAKVRGWISSRNPQVAKALFGQAGSFVETTSRDAVIRDIKGRMEHIKQELNLLHPAH